MNVKKEIKGQIDIYEFLKAFFATALVPVVQNRSNFIETKYFENITYDTVLINFFALKYENFSLLFLNQDQNQLVLSETEIKRIKNKAEIKIFNHFFNRLSEEQKKYFKQEYLVFDYLNFEIPKIENELKNSEFKIFELKVKVSVKDGVDTPLWGTLDMNIKFDFSPFFKEKEFKYDYKKTMNNIFFAYKGFLQRTNSQYVWFRKQHICAGI